MTKEMICINCPVGCTLQVSQENGIIKVTGNICARGEKYGIAEFTNPVRMVTTIMKVEGTHRPVPVRLTSPVPKAMIGQVLEAIAQHIAPKTTVRYDVLIKNVAGTGSDVIATADA